MSSIFDDLGFAQKIYLEACYSHLISEIDEKKSHGQIVRGMIKEGYKLDDAEKTYQLIIADLGAFRTQANVLRSEINRQEKREAITQQAASSQQDMARWEEQHRVDGLMHHAGHTAMHLGGHLALKMVGRIFGIPL